MCILAALRHKHRGATIQVLQLRIRGLSKRNALTIKRHFIHQGFALDNLAVTGQFQVILKQNEVSRDQIDTLDGLEGLLLPAHVHLTLVQTRQSQLLHVVIQQLHVQPRTEERYKENRQRMDLTIKKIRRASRNTRPPR